jgi:hypothetical protein
MECIKKDWDETNDNLKESSKPCETEFFLKLKESTK